MLDSVIPLALVVSSWLLLAAVFVGVGLLVRGVFRPPTWSARAVFTSFWVGWGLVLAYLQIWNFFAPITGWALAVPGVAGITGVVVHHRTLVSSLVARDRRGLALLGLSFLLALWLANQSIAPQDNDNDAGVYRINAILWSESFQVVPGLANLNIHLGYNNSYFLYLAMVDTSLPVGQFYALGYSLLLIVALVRMAAAVLQVASEKRRAKPEDFLFALVLVPTLAQERWWRETATSTDAPVFLLEVVITAELLRLLTEGHREQRNASSSASIADVATIVLLSAAGVATKTSMTVFAGMTLTVLAVRILSTGCGRARVVALGVACVMAGLMLVPWLARGVILSGYLLFPSSTLALPVDWRVPQAEVDQEAQYVVGFARTRDVKTYQTALAGWGWVQHWFEMESPTFAIPSALAAVGIVASARRVAARPILASLVPAAVAAGAWFLIAPDGRFAGAVFWLLGAGATTAVALSLPARAGSYVVVLVGAVAVAQHVIPLAGLHPVRPGPLAGFYSLPRPPLGQFTTTAGLVVGIPLSGGQIWGTSLLATPTPNDRLRLRQANDVSAGFTTAL